MNLRNLTLKQLKDSAIAAEAARQKWFHTFNISDTPENRKLWEAAYSKGFVAGLELWPSSPTT